jgi:uncharacterized protein YndB with AHSA1/START domain
LSTAPIRVEQVIDIARAVDDVFAYVTDPDRLPEWQKGTVQVRREDGAGPLREGDRLHEVHRAMGRNMRSTVEVAEIEPGRAFALRIVEGPLPLDGRWTFEPTGTGTRVRFTGEGDLRGPMRLAAPIVRRAVARQFRGHHERLKGVLEQTALARGNPGG